MTRPLAPTRVVRPRVAASLILVRHDGPETRVLMGRRAEGASFMPRQWVFPGGRCDPADRRASVAKEARPQMLAALRSASPASVSASAARAMAIASVRETYEETGLRLGEGAMDAPWIDLSALRFVARAVTPPSASRRFDARFFEADAEALDRLDPRRSAELDEVAWLTLAEARDQETPRVTRILLDETERRRTAPHLAPIQIRTRNGVHRVNRQGFVFPES